MPFGTITSTESTFGSISGSIVGAVPGTLSGSVGVPGPQGIQGPVGPQGPQGIPGVGGAWGSIVGTLSNQTDLQTALNAKYDASNPAGFITSSALSPYLTSATAASIYQTLAGMSSYLTTSAAAAGYYPLSGNPSSFLTASALTGYATQSFVASNYAPIAAGLPTGGTVGQVLTKNSGTDYDDSWQTLIPGDRYLTTSSTSNSVSNGAKTFTVGTGLSYSSQQDVVISYDAANHMHALVTSYNSGTGVLVVDVQHHTGSGTYASWTVNVGGTTPLQSVYWGEILGTLGDQTDLATALNGKLNTSTAASTYAPLAGATFNGEVVTPASTTSSAGLMITPGVAPSAPVNGEIWATTNDLQVRLNGVTETLAEQSWVTSQGYITSSALTPYLTSATAASTYQTISGMSSYLTTSAAASTYRALTNNTFGSMGITAGNALIIDDGGSPIGETVLQNSGLLIRDTSNVPLARFQYDQVLIPSVGITFSDATTQTTAGISSATATATFAPKASPTFTGTVTIPAGASISGYATTAALASYAPLAGATFTGEIILPASTTATASLTIPHGAAPSTPVNGEIWTTSAGLFYQINGATVSPATLAGGTYTGKITTAASTTSNAGLRIPNGTAPTAPTTGDLWLVSGAAGSLTFQGNGTQTVATLGYNQTFTGNNTFSGAISTFGNSTAASTINISTGATATATTKTVNIATNGTSGSTTVVNIGSSVSGATSTITLNGTVNATGLANGVKAWVNFNGTGTVAIRASFNVSSITDNGVGDYTVNFTTALADANYAAICTAKDVGGTWDALYAAAQTASAVRVQTRGTGSFVDTDTFCLAAIR